MNAGPVKAMHSGVLIREQRTICRNGGMITFTSEDCSIEGNENFDRQYTRLLGRLGQR